jgi:hypothetical protein
MIQVSPEKKKLLLNSLIIFLFWLLRLTFFAPGACISFSDYLGTFIPALLLSIIILGLVELLTDIDYKKTLLGVVVIGFVLFLVFIPALMATGRFFLILALIFAFIAFHEKKALPKVTKLERWTIRLMGFLFPALWIAGWECAIYNQSWGPWSMRLCLLVGEAFVVLTWKISHREIRSI